jgi:hypothetical protein
MQTLGLHVSDETFIQVAGGELLFLLLSGTLPQVVVLVAGIPFNATLFFLGYEELIGASANLRSHARAARLRLESAAGAGGGRRPLPRAPLAAADAVPRRRNDASVVAWDGGDTDDDPVPHLNDERPRDRIGRRWAPRRDRRRSHGRRRPDRGEASPP